jgi:hypothetical protein
MEEGGREEDGEDLSRGEERHRIFSGGCASPQYRASLHIVQCQYPTKECKVRFPIVSEAFFAKEEQGVGTLGREAA